jgi:DNA-binding NarL/FixJ family response regulator
LEKIVEPIHTAVLENFQSIIDGYYYRLEKDEAIQITAVARFGEQMEEMLANNHLDVLLIEPCVPVSDTNPNIYPTWTVINRITKQWPNLKILVITENDGAGVVKQAIDSGVHGCIFKTDAQTICTLPSVIKVIASGGIHYSRDAYQILQDQYEGQSTLTKRQHEALSLCAAYPNDTAKQLAQRMKIAPSTFRSILSLAYEQLNVNSRMAAVEKARRYGWIA